MPLVVGLPGTTLSTEEKVILERVQPAGVILFSRNISTPEQVRELVGAIRELEPRPFVTVDLEGGMVNRLSALWGELPTPGAACRNLGIHLDLAPVVDLDCPDGCLGVQGRCFSQDPVRVAILARVFNKGLASHLAVFEELGPEFPAVMVAHAVVPGLGDAEQPASLSRTVVERASKLPGSPVVLADDLEMGALDAVGDLPERVVAAVLARNHGVLVCNAFDRLDDIMTRLNDLSTTDSTLGTRLTEMSARMGTLRRDLLQRAAAVPAPDDATVEQLWQQARREAAQ